jgi:hypothetical protein
MNNKVDLNTLRQTKEFTLETKHASKIKNNFFTKEEIMDMVKKYPNDIDLGKNIRIEYLKRFN